MALTLVDTSAWIQSLRKNGIEEVRSRVKTLLENGDAAWCSMVRLELWTGAQGSHEKKVFVELEKEIPELEISAAVWSLACKLAKKTREAGKTVPPTDLLIAACARHHKAGLEHADSHFDMIPSLP